jgi:Carboxypeptidase regulatory-like domain
MGSRLRAYALASLVFFAAPTLVHAQSAIAGTVRDATGAVLPGVVVEASSAALIEKARATTSDSDGQYRIIDLRPGTYTVTFTLTGFQTVARSGIVLETNFTAPINVEMRLGSVEETITVTGESPVVDVQTSARRDVISRNLLDVLPTGRNYMWMANTVPAVSAAGFDVGGSATMWSGGALTVHGSLTSDARTLIDGLIADGMMGTGQCACVYDNEMQTQEMAVHVGGGSAEHQLSGVIINRIPRTGGNTFSGDQVLLFSNGSLQSVNIDEDLERRGITTPGKLFRLYDVNYSLGGPIVKDRLWFFFSGRNWAYDQYAANTFNPDGSQYADVNILMAYPVRLTTQLNEKNKLTGLFNWSNRIRQNYQIPNPGQSPEAISRLYTPTEYIVQGKWTSTLSSKLLLEAGYNLTNHNVVYAYKGPEYMQEATCFVAFDQCPPGTSYGSIAHRDTIRSQDTVAPFPGTGAGQGPERRPSQSHVVNVSLTYATGSHALKMGFQDRSGSVRTTRIINADLGQQYRNGVPFAVVVMNTPIDTTINLNHDMGVYIQDSWTMNRLTLNPGVRWDYFNSSIPAQTKPAGRFVGEQHFEAIENVPNWHNVTPRFGASFDPTGSGRTALKANFGVYVTGQGPGFVQNYNPSFTATDSRTWDDRNRDDIAQENEIGPGTTTFGVRRNQYADPDLSRPYQIVWDAGVQHEVFPGLGVSVSYNQRSVYKDLWTNNLAIQDSDYILLTVPDPRGNGELLPVYNLPPDKFGLVNELDTNSELNGRIYRGVDATFNLRIPGGAQVTGGTSTGRSLTKTCQVENQNSLRFCDQSQYDVPLQTSLKISGAYPLPYNILLAGVFQSLPGSERSITYQVTRAQLPSLTAASVNVRLNEPGTVYNDRINQLDLTVARSFKKGSFDLRPEVAFFNVLNVNPVTSVVNVWGTSLNNVNAVLNPRLIRFGVTAKF